MQVMPVFAPSQILAGKYRLVRKLGQGGMGSVWYADHLALNSPVAIKVVDPEIASHPDALARFMREAQAAASLRSPHVVQIFDYGVDDGVPYIAMELLEGESLAARLERATRLSPEETSSIMMQVGRAVSRAHEANIIHRDLKPDNIFLVRNDEDQVAKVLDFGIAKTSTGLEVSSVTRTGAVLGTPFYMSPEQATGDKSLDHRTDIWAMGVIAYECLLGRRPFAGDTMATIFVGICAAPLPIPSSAGAVPPGFDAWFLRACARDLRERFSSAKEAAHALRAACGFGSAQARTSASDAHPWPVGTSTTTSSGGVTRPRSPSSVSSHTASVLLHSSAKRRMGPPLVIGASGLRAASHGRSLPLDTPFGRERRRVRGHIGGTDPATHFGRVLSQARTIGQGRAPAAPSRAAPPARPADGAPRCCRISPAHVPPLRPSCRVTSRAVRRRSAPQLRRPPRPPPPRPDPWRGRASKPKGQSRHLKHLARKRVR